MKIACGIVPEGFILEESSYDLGEKMGIDVSDLERLNESMWKEREESYDNQPMSIRELVEGGIISPEFAGNWASIAKTIAEEYEDAFKVESRVEFNEDNEPGFFIDIVDHGGEPITTYTWEEFQKTFDEGLKSILPPKRAIRLHLFAEGIPASLNSAKIELTEDQEESESKEDAE